MFPHTQKGIVKYVLATWSVFRVANMSLYLAWAKENFSFKIYLRVVKAFSFLALLSFPCNA